MPTYTCNYKKCIHTYIHLYVCIYINVYFYINVYSLIICVAVCVCAVFVSISNCAAHVVFTHPDRMAVAGNGHGWPRAARRFYHHHRLLFCICIPHVWLVTNARTHAESHTLCQWRSRIHLDPHQRLSALLLVLASFATNQSINHQSSPLLRLFPVPHYARTTIIATIFPSSSLESLMLVWFHTT